MFCFIAENQRDFVKLLATVTNSPGSEWIEPVLETKTEDLLKRSLQILDTDEQKPFMHLEFQVIIIQLTFKLYLYNKFCYVLLGYRYFRKYIISIFMWPSLFI